MLASRDNILPIFFGWFALKSFTESVFVKAMATKLTGFEPPTGRQAKPCVLKLAPELHPKGDEGLLPSEYEKTIRKMKHGVLYTPWATNFPLVDAFFSFLKSNPMMLVGLRMATASGRHNSHTQLPACTAKGAFKSTAMYILCVWLCVPAETQGKEVEKGAEYVEGCTKCTAETHNGNNNKKTAQTDDRNAAQAAAIHTRFIENKKLPLRLTQTPSHKIIINKKKSSIAVPHKF
ncbi:hypothetical protein TCSYLVIO_006659 [Trypanosoma cruzi]|nr:hypothetical protein TCSYLVIO_006659 [Trypanosoma cruzi]